MKQTLKLRHQAGGARTTAYLTYHPAQSGILKGPMTWQRTTEHGAACAFAPKVTVSPWKQSFVIFRRIRGGKRLDFSINTVGIYTFERFSSPQSPFPWS
jgi:hypothetical protein